MATKMCFAVNEKSVFEEIIVEYEHTDGLVSLQKQKNVLSFHKSIQERFEGKRIIEISTKSQSPFGVSLSAFNLMLDGYPVECVYQSSKVFEGNVQFENLLTESAKTAKKFIMENVSLPVIGFRYKGEEFGLLPRSMFYDYTYISALLESKSDVSIIGDYDIFTDIEFDEKTGYNCQARACAIYAYMLRTGKVNYYMSSRERFKELYDVHNCVTIEDK